MFSKIPRLLKGAILTVTASFLLVAVALHFFSPPKAELWDRWASHDENSDTVVSHDAWDQLLQKFVSKNEDDVALVHYDSFSADDRRILDQYVASLEDTAVTRLNRDEQRAYWINMYNAVTVKVILDHYPVDSIREIDIASEILANGPWKAKLVEVEGQELTLDDIEHRILRPIWQDARTHYAINCGAISCPNLHDRAFKADDIDETLDVLAREYVNSSRGLEIKDGDVHASKIFKWFQSDFGGTEEAVLDHVRTYASNDLREKLSNFTSIGTYHYDWALNRAKKDIEKDRKTSKRTQNTSKDRRIYRRGS